MKLITLVENKSNYEQHLAGEHGLSVYIEYGPHKLLLDAGTTALFAQNAKRLRVDLGAVDIAVLSHAHYDHSGGFETFFRENTHAGPYLQASCRENCWRIPGHLKKAGEPELSGLCEGQLKYIGLPKGFLNTWQERIISVEGDVQLAPGIWLIAHHTKRLWETGRAAGMCRLEADGYCYDDFSHEQSLVLETRPGLFVLNSCCHSGPETVIREVSDRPCFLGKPVYALMGGFHLKDIPADRQGEMRIEQLGQSLFNTGVPHFYTGHCTGDWAYDRLKHILGDWLHALKTGTVLQAEELPEGGGIH